LAEFVALACVQSGGRLIETERTGSEHIARAISSLR
jgi:hypothetical protein